MGIFGDAVTLINRTTKNLNVRFDGRDQTNAKVYVDGAEVNAATSNLGKLTSASGPLFAFVMAEKTSDDSPLGFRSRIRVRTMQEDAER